MGTVQNRNDNGELVIRGSYYAPESSATVFNNLVSKGLRGSSAFRAYLGAANVLNQFQLGYSAFHAGFTSVDAMVSSLGLAVRQASQGEVLKALKSIADTPFAPVTNAVRGSRMLKEWNVPGSTTPEIAALIEAATKGGARARMDKFYHAEMTKHMLTAFRSGNILGGLVRVPFAVTEQAVKPVLEWLVPRQKMGIIAQALKYELEKNPNMTHEEAQKVAAQVVDSVDNRMGQLIYDNLFWNKVAKDLGMASVRSLGWNLGTIRELGGGLLDFVKQGVNVARGQKAEMTYRMSYVIALPVLVGIMGAVYQYLSTGEAPQELKDYYYPRTGGIDEHGRPERVVLPSYMKDVYHYAMEPGRTVTNKLHPAITLVADMLRNEDYYGVQIRNEDDPLFKQLLEVAGYTIKAGEPLALRGLRKNIELGHSGAEAALPFVGITPAPSKMGKTEAEILADELRAEHMPKGSRTKEQFDRSQTAARLTRELRAKDPEAGERIAQAFRTGEISRAQLRDIIQHSTMQPLQIAFAPLPYEEAMKVMEVATEEEKNLLMPMLLRKRKEYIRNYPARAVEVKDQVYQ